MRILQLSDENRVKAHKLVEFASQPENHYVIGRTKFVPGDRPEYVVEIDTVRCVFTFTKLKGKLYRHLSMSVPGALPNEVLAYTIATWFGFKGAAMSEDVALGPGPDWQMSFDPLVRAIQFVQPV